MINFIKYNNAIPITLFIVFGITSATYAASPEVRSAVYKSEQEVRKVDNTYIVSANVQERDFRMQVTDVKEDADMFYVTYAYSDIGLVDYVWKETPETKSFTVSKKELEGRDLGLYVAKQLGEVLASKRAFLADVQKFERQAGATTKVVATTYSGIVGKFLDAKEETFPGYVAVVAPQPSTYDNPVPVIAAVERALNDGKVSVSLPNTSATQTQQLTQAQIEALVAEQVRAILAGTSVPQLPDPSPTTSNSTPTPAPDNTATSTEPVVVEPAPQPEPTPTDSTATTTAPVEPVQEPAPEPVVEPAPAPEPAPEPTPEPEPAPEPVVEASAPAEAPTEAQ